MVILEAIESAWFRLPVILETAKRFIKPLKYRTTYHLVASTNSENIFCQNVTVHKHRKYPS